MTTAIQIINHLLEEQGTTLVIHKDDRTTDFLKAIYDGLGYPVITGSIPPEELMEQIESHDRIYMMGHGSPYGMFGSGYLIDSRFGPALAKKRDGLYIWCFAEVYARKHKLNGLVSGMFISEVGEAAANGIRATQEEVDASNNAFAKYVRAYLDGGTSPHEVKKCYTSASCKITKFNNDRLFVMEGGVPMREDGTPEPEKPKEEQPEIVYERPFNPAVRQLIWIIGELDGAFKPPPPERSRQQADVILQSWARTLSPNRILDELNVADTPEEAMATVIFETGLFNKIKQMPQSLFIYTVAQAVEILSSSSG